MVGVTFRLNNEQNRDRFGHAVADYGWESSVTSDVDDYMERFIETILKIY